MKNIKVIQKIGFIIFVIGTVSRYLGKLLGKEINETLKYGALISFCGIVIWGVGYFIAEYKKKNNSEEMNTDSKEQLSS